MSRRSKLALLDDSSFPVDLIEIGKNIRDVSEKDPETRELANSIKAYGQLEPVGIELDENSNGKFRLIYGHRRFIAISKLLKDKTIKVVRVLSEANVETQLIENIHRKDLTDLEIAYALKEIKDKTKKKNRELAKIVCKSEDWVESKLKHIEVLHSLDKETREKVKTLPTEKVKIARKLDTEKRKEALTEIAEKNQSVKEARDTVKKHSEGISETSRKTRDHYPQSSENQQTNLIGKIETMEYEIHKLQSMVKKYESEIQRLKKIKTGQEKQPERIDFRGGRNEFERNFFDEVKKSIRRYQKALGLYMKIDEQDEHEIYYALETFLSEKWNKMQK